MSDKTLIINSNQEIKEIIFGLFIQNGGQFTCLPPQDIATQMKVDAGNETLPVAITPALHLDPLDPAVATLGRAVANLQYNGIDDPHRCFLTMRATSFIGSG